MDPTPEPTPVGGNVPTPESKPADVFKAFASKKEHDDYLNSIVEDRLDRERKKYADYDDLKAKAKKLKVLEEKDMTDVDKLRQEHQEATGKVTSLSSENSSLKLENAKLKALIKAGASPDSLDGLLKRVTGNDEKEIFADVEELKALGWIGTKPSAPTPEPTKGIGSGTQTPPAAKPPDVKEQIAALTQQAIDPKLTPIERGRIQDQILALKMKAGGFVIA